MFDQILCDFDGTLVDSSDGILTSLRECISRAGYSVIVEPSKSLIGPPLRSLISQVVGPDHSGVEDLEAAFRSEYDQRGYLLTVPFPGIPRAIREFCENGIALHIVSNKRLVPLRRILTMLGWDDYFASVNTLDSIVGASSKSHVVARLLERFRLPLNSLIVVGDSLDDERAARENGIEFGWASWGYGQESMLRECGHSFVDADDFRHQILNAKSCSRILHDSGTTGAGTIS